MKKLQKRTGKDYQLALDLYASGNYDAMYFAGLIADDLQMTEDDLQLWAENATAASLSGYTVAWVAAGSRYGWQTGLKWIELKESKMAVAGWNTLASVVALKPDAELDLPKLEKLMSRVQKTMSEMPDLVRYAMNNFLIAVGCYVQPLSALALQTAESIGEVRAKLGNNSCQIPYAPDYIRKVRDCGSIGKKRKTVKC